MTITDKIIMKRKDVWHLRTCFGCLQNVRKHQELSDIANKGKE